MLDGQGINALIPFKSNTKVNGKHNGHSEVWSRLFHFFSLHREEFLASYHTRSNVESNSCVFVMDTNRFIESSDTSDS